ncbi:putative zinc-binding metallopeptidase [Candidatus Pelagibacter communis]|uniref:putative zinc-binding metallopeptidase n=1 Tax=Pelagibacter ubique TaxID=198252 RepID=UPI00094DD1D6|nr:putative zinc-binding metallopeptidase [Candidatus Pelagibacter ubique]
MRIFVILILSVFVHNQLYAGNITPEVRQAYKERTEFVKKYISTIKENRKTNKKFKGSIVEAVSGRLYTSWGTLSQYELDQKALKNCKSDGEIECLVRFRTLKKNPKYNRYAKYIKSKSSLKVLGEHIKSKKKFSSKGIDILISTENFKNKNDFFCGQTKSNYKDVINNLVKEINVYPASFLKNSGLKYVMICEKITDKSLGFEPGGLAPGHVDQSPGVFYLNLSAVNKIKNSKAKKDYIRILFHHEFYHIIDSKLSLMQLDEAWEKINKVDYSNDLITGGIGIDTSVEGFISGYARNNSAEDKAELFAFMVAQHKEFKKAIAKDEILLKKSKLMISRLKGISKEIDKSFWKKLN